VPLTAPYKLSNLHYITLHTLKKTYSTERVEIDAFVRPLNLTLASCLDIWPPDPKSRSLHPLHRVDHLWHYLQNKKLISWWDRWTLPLEPRHPCI